MQPTSKRLAALVFCGSCRIPRLRRGKSAGAGIVCTTAQTRRRRCFRARLSMQRLWKVPALESSGDCVYESLVCVEYIDECFSRPPIMPATPVRPIMPLRRCDAPTEDSVGLYSRALQALRARARVWLVHLSERVIPQFYKILMLKADERQAAVRDYTEGVRVWAGVRLLSRCQPSLPRVTGSRTGASGL